MTREPSVSICISYWRDKHIVERCIDSLYDQDYPNYEIRFCGDGEGLPKLLKEKYCKKDNFYHKVIEHSGAPACRNAAAEGPKGELIIFWDSDTVMKPGSLRKFVNGITMNNADISHSAFEYSDDPNVAARDLHTWDGKEVSNDGGWELGQANLLDTSSMMTMKLWKKLKAQGGWDSNIKQFQDWDLWLRAVKLGARLAFIPSPLFIKELSMKDKHSISAIQSKRFDENRAAIWKKHGVVASKLCLTSLADPSHARHVAKVLGANYLGAPLFRPFYKPASHTKAIMCIGFHCRHQEYDSHRFLFSKVAPEKMGDMDEDVAKIIFWSGGDVAHFFTYLSYITAKYTMQEIRKDFNAFIVPTPLIKRQLRESKINATVARLPYMEDFGLLPLPDKFTVALYCPDDVDDKNMKEVTLEVAKKCKGVKFLLYGDSGLHPKYPSNVKATGLHWGEDWKKFMGKCSVLFNVRMAGPVLGAWTDFATAGRQTITNVENVKGCDFIKFPPGVIADTETFTDYCAELINTKAEMYDAHKSFYPDNVTRERREFVLKHYDPKKFKRTVWRVVNRAIFRQRIKNIWRKLWRRKNALSSGQATSALQSTDSQRPSLPSGKAKKSK